MHPLLNLVPAVLCLVGGGLTAATMHADMKAGTLHLQDNETLIGGGIILACAVGGAISAAAAFGGIA